MSSNKNARQRLEKIFGKICMIEEIGIRKIPKEQRRKIKGYTKYDDVITYHHIKEKHEGGKATEENGALIKGYNHRWLHTLPEEQKEKINNSIIEFKATVLQTTGKTIQADSKLSITLEEPSDDFITIQLEDITPEIQNKRHFNRAKIKRETQRRIEQELDDEYYI